MRFYTNSEIADFLEMNAIAYEIKGNNIFRANAYQNAASTALTYPESLFELWQKDPKSLDEIPGIGPSILNKLDHLFRYNEYNASVKAAIKGLHPAIFTLTKINGIGPKIAFALTKKLEFSKTDPELTISQLIHYAKADKIKKLPHFGDKSEHMILENTLNFLGAKTRMSYEQAKAISNKVLNHLKEIFPDTEFYELGSLRRKSETIGDIDIAAKSTDNVNLLNHFTQYPEIVQILIRGPKKASIRVLENIRVDLMVQPEKSFGSLLQHFTGSKQHNIELRKYALSLGYSMSEYGIKDLKTGKLHEFTNEEDVYNFLNLNYIEPEKRIGKDEIENAKR